MHACIHAYKSRTHARWASAAHASSHFSVRSESQAASMHNSVAVRTELCLEINVNAIGMECDVETCTHCQSSWVCDCAEPTHVTNDLLIVADAATSRCDSAYSSGCVVPSHSDNTQLTHTRMDCSQFANIGMHALMRRQCHPLHSTASPWRVAEAGMRSC
jgi:hypothetical protein